MTYFETIVPNSIESVKKLQIIEIEVPQSNDKIAGLRCLKVF